MTDFPEWAVPGAKVLFVSTRYGDRSFGSGVISRLTKTRIVVTQNEGRYESQFVRSSYDKGRWEQYGRGDNWSSPPYLIGGDSDEAKALYAEAAKQRIQANATEACNTFIRTRDAATAQAAIDALTKFIETN